MSRPDRRTTALLLLVAGTLSFGSSAVLIKLCRLPPPAIASLRMIGAGLLLSVSAARSLRDLPAARRGRLLLLLIPGVLLGLHFQFWVAGIKRTTAAAGTFLFAVNPVLFAVAERFFYRRRLDRGALLSLALIAAGGLWLVAVTRTPVVSTGNLLCFISTVLFVFYLIAAEQLAGSLPHPLFLHIVYLSGGLVTLPLIAAGAAAPAPGTWTHSLSYLWLAGLVILPTLLGHGSITYAVRFFSPLTVSFFSLAEPLLATLYALLLLAERPPLIELPAYTLFFLSTVLFLLARRNALAAADAT